MSEKPKRILTGIQSTGIPHLGNILGAIIPAINFSKKDNVETYLFIADFHSLTQIKDSKALKQNTLFTASAWLACGLNPSHTIFYRQSDVPQVTELAWYLSCFFPYNRDQWMISKVLTDTGKVLYGLNSEILEIGRITNS